MGKGRRGLRLCVGLVVVVVVVVVVGCETAIPTSTPAPTPAPQPTPVTSTVPGLVAAGTFQDAVGDVIDSLERQVRTRDDLDIRSLEAIADGSTLRLTLTFAGPLRPPPPPAVERMSYGVHLWTDGDLEALPGGEGGGLKWAVEVTNATVSEGFQPSLWDLPEQDLGRAVRYQGALFPGRAVVTGDTIVWTIGLAAIGNPRLIWLRVGAASTSDTGSDDRLGMTDELPDPGAAEAMLLLQP
jgi:hypothetical protein